MDGLDARLTEEWLLVEQVHCFGPHVPLFVMPQSDWVVSCWVVLLAPLDVSEWWWNLEASGPPFAWSRRQGRAVEMPLTAGICCPSLPYHLCNIDLPLDHAGGVNLVI